MNTEWHFWIMILASVVVFLLMIRLVAGRKKFRAKRVTILILVLIVVVIGMLMGKYGAMMGLPWWIYYPLPLLMTLVLPPVTLKFNRQQTLQYLLLSLLSAPFIHLSFSFLLNWHEYMPFWIIPSLSQLLQ